MLAAWVQSSLVPICSGTTVLGYRGQALPPQRQSEPSGSTMKIPGNTRSGAWLRVRDTTTAGGKLGFDLAKKQSAPARRMETAVPKRTTLFRVEIGVAVRSAGRGCFDDPPTANSIVPVRRLGRPAKR